MDEAMMHIIERHLGQIGEVEITNNKGEVDKIKLASLEVEDMVYLPRLLSVISVTDMERGQVNIMDRMTPEITKVILDLGWKMVKPNYPDMSEKDGKRIVLANMFTFLGEMWKVYFNIDTRVDSDAKKRLVANVRAAQSKEAGKGVPPASA